MSLVVSTDLSALAARLHLPGAPDRILTFSTSIPSSLPPDVDWIEAKHPPAPERLKLLDEYVEAISQLGALNRFSTAWLAHPLSEKNDLERNPLFKQIVDYLAFRRGWDARGARGLAVLAPRKSLVTNILAYAQTVGEPCETPGFSWKPPGALRTVKGLMSRIRGERRNVRRLAAYAARSRPILDAIDRSPSYTLIRTWFDARSRTEIEADRDVFLGPLPGVLRQHGRRLLYYGGITDIDRRFEATFDDLEQVRSHAILPEVALLNRFDLFAIFLFCLSFNRQIHLPDQIALGGFDIRPVIDNFLSKRATLAGVRKNYMSYRAARRLTGEFCLDEAFSPFENNNSQKLLTKTLREARPPIPLKAFQHAQVAQSSSRLFLGADERALLPLPDRIVTLGAYTRTFLVERKNYPPARTRVGCALRQDRLPLPGSARPNRRRVLVCLWTMQRSVQLLRFLDRAGLAEAGYGVRIRPHPVQPIGRVERRLGFRIEDRFEVSRAPLAFDLESCDAVIYSGTTACLDAMAAGLPVINVEFDDFISPDPLFEFRDFKWTVRAPEELGNALREIEDLNDGDYALRRDRARAFVSEYFYPVTEANLEAFLD